MSLFSRISPEIIPADLRLTLNLFPSISKGKALIKLSKNFQKVRYLAGVYLFKVNNGNPKKNVDICLNLIIKTPERHQ